LRTDAVNAITDAIRHAAPAANSPQVTGVTLPLRGSMQCFTPITESPSMAATSTARAPPSSSADSASARWTRAGSNARSSGDATARGTGTGSAGPIATSPPACSAKAATVPDCGGGGTGRALTTPSPAAWSADAATVLDSRDGESDGRAPLTMPPAAPWGAAATMVLTGRGSGGGG